MPCVGVKVVSQYDLPSYAVEVRLPQSILDSVRDDGSDIYFLDENKNPLTYAVWLIRKDKGYGSVFVQLSLERHTPRRIYMCYGEENKYPEYRRPDLVFDLYDDFETLDESKWMVKAGDVRVENGHLVIPHRGWVETQRMFGNVEIRTYYVFDEIGWFGVYARVRYEEIPDYTLYEISKPLRLAVFQLPGTCVDEHPYIDYKTGVYYEEVYRTLRIGGISEAVVRSTWIVQGYMDNRLILEATCTAPDSGTILMLSYDSTVRVDKLFVRYAVDPEPTVSFEEPQRLTPKPYPQPWILLIPIIPLGVYMYTRRKHKE